MFRTDVSQNHLGTIKQNCTRNKRVLCPLWTYKRALLDSGLREELKWTMKGWFFLQFNIDFAFWMTSRLTSQICSLNYMLAVFICFLRSNLTWTLILCCQLHMEEHILTYCLIILYSLEKKETSKMSFPYLLWKVINMSKVNTVKRLESSAVLKWTCLRTGHSIYFVLSNTITTSSKAISLCLFPSEMVEGLFIFIVYPFCWLNRDLLQSLPNCCPNFGSTHLYRNAFVHCSIANSFHWSGDAQSSCNMVMSPSQTEIHESAGKKLKWSAQRWSDLNPH